MVDVPELKKRFARALLRRASPWDAICYAIPEEVADREGLDRWSRAREWAHDSEVVAFQRAIHAAEGDDALGLPTREDFILEMASKLSKTNDPIEYAKLGTLYANVRGWTQKPGGEAPTVTVVNNVMYVPQFGTDAEWEAEAEAQQRALVAHGESVN